LFLQRFFLPLSLLAMLAPASAAIAQADTIPAETVAWTVAPAEAKPGAKLVLTLNGSVVEGWHVYSLQQLPLGPNPLRVSVEGKDVAVAEGAPSESKPVKAKDAAFGFETQYYDKPFTVSVPVRLAKTIAPGQQTVPVTVKFQTCNGRICQPPKAVHLSVPVTVKG
jgi:DsbC/DsbD-like thiol-disulfide interchange protein